MYVPSCMRSLFFSAGVVCCRLSGQLATWPSDTRSLSAKNRVVVNRTQTRYCGYHIIYYTITHVCRICCRRKIAMGKINERSFSGRPPRDTSQRIIIFTLR